jgi:hypothetical protein
MTESNILYIKLNLDKLKNLLDRHEYIIEQVFCQKDSIRFLECRTPKFQKTFIIYIPERYLMTLPSNSIIKKLNISVSKSDVSSQQISFMVDAKGPLLECDLLTISSETMCLYLNTGESNCFYITDSENSDSENKEEVDEYVDEIDTLERDAAVLLQKIKPGAKLPKASLRKKKDEKEDSDNDSSTSSKEEENSDDDTSSSSNLRLNDEKKDKKIELFFEEENGESVDEIKSLLESSAHMEDSLSRIKEKIDNTDSNDDEKDSETEEYTTRDNSLPSEIEEREVTLGIIYILIDIRKFFKVVSIYEEELINNYNQIEDNEEEIKKKKLCKVKNLCNELISHSEKRLKEIFEEEERLKIHLVRLTIVLTQSGSLKNKLAQNPSKYGSDVIAETIRIYKETKETIHELNLELLKLKDTTEDLLSNYISSIQELLEL